MIPNKKRRYAAGELIFHEGDFGDCAFIVESGRVEIFMEGPVEKVCLNILGIGEIFGEMSVIDGSPRSASAVAVEPCELIIVSREAISERIEGADPIVRLLISMLLNRMRVANQSAMNAKRIMNIDDSEEVDKTGIKSLSKASLSDQRDAVLEKMRLESELKQALADDEFQLHFQPIKNLKHNFITGFEALIRWNSPTRGLVRPDMFMSLAEETSLIVPVGRWVIDKACECLAEMESAVLSSLAPRPLYISINISGRQFSDPQFFNYLTRATKANGVHHENLKLEVTERIFMEGPNAIHAIKKCRSLGFPVMLDDFGTGYSSLSYLAQFFVDSLKIDQSFVRKITTDSRTLAIVKAVLKMAEGLDIPVVAEGIETEEDFDMLRKLNCGYGQGYLFSRPVEFQKAMELLFEDLRVGYAG